MPKEIEPWTIFTCKDCEETFHLADGCKNNCEYSKDLQEEHLKFVTWGDK